MILRDVIYIGIGSGIGGILRFLSSRIPLPLSITSHFPIHTLLTNIIGSLVLGALTGWLITRGDLPEHYKLGLTMGLCGGFTTFSTLALDGWKLLEKGANLSFFLYVILSLLLGILAVWAGILLGRYLSH